MPSGVAPPDAGRPPYLWVLPFEIPEWFPNNVARNSAPTGSNIELASLELQRFWGISKNDRVKLRAKFGWGRCCLRPRAPQQGPAAHGHRSKFPPPTCAAAWPRRCPPHLWVLPFEIPEWFPNNVARNSPAYISSFEIGSLKFRGFLDASEKLGYPNYVRLLVSFGVVGLWGCVVAWSGCVVGRATNNQAFCSAPCMANIRPTMIVLLSAWNSHE